MTRPKHLPILVDGVIDWATTEELNSKGGSVSPKKKSLPDISEVKQKFNNVGIPGFIATDPEISKWLLSVFKWKESGEIGIRFSDIASELSEFSGKEITGDHISKVHRKWKRSGKL